MRPIAPPLTTLVMLGTLAVLVQACVAGRDLYYVDEAPPVHELQTTISGDAGTDDPDSSTDGDASDEGGRLDAPTPQPPAPPANPPLGGTRTCTTLATTCVKGGAMQTCITTSATGACSKLEYTHDGKAFACPKDCTSEECQPSYYAAYTSCQDAAGACSQLAVCCEAAGLLRRLVCREAHKTYIQEAYSDIACKAALTSYRDQGVCP